MDKLTRGKELSQLSRFLFDSAANKFYFALGMEIVAGAVGTVAALIQLDGQGKLAFAIVGFLLLAVSYVLKVRFEDEYDRAETMRRQSVLSEALDWDISKVQFSEWRQKAGREILNRLKKESRPDDYYETQEDLGPRRLLEMTRESAFYTRCLYNKLYGIIGISLLVSFGMLVFVLSAILPMQILPSSTQVVVAYAVYIVLPLILSSDLLGWFLRLGRIKSEIFRIEEAMERIAKQKTIRVAEVMRLVSEYNCQLIGGLPIPNLLFNFWHCEIKDLWETR